MEKLLSRHYKDNFITYDLADVLYKHLNKNTIIVNIGTDRCIGDCLSPLLGTLLKESDFKFPVYGTIKEPIHALNIERRLKEIKLKHPNAYVIGVDACLGNYENIGEIQVRDYPVHPGKGVGKDLQDVGDISIIGIVDSSENSEIFTNRNIRLDFIYDMSKIIANSFKIAEERYYIENKEIAISGF